MAVALVKGQGWECMAMCQWLDVAENENLSSPYAMVNVQLINCFVFQIANILYLHI